MSNSLVISCRPLGPHFCHPQSGVSNVFSVFPNAKSGFNSGTFLFRFDAFRNSDQHGLGLAKFSDNKLFASKIDLIDQICQSVSGFFNRNRLDHIKSLVNIVNFVKM